MHSGHIYPTFSLIYFLPYPLLPFSPSFLYYFCKSTSTLSADHMDMGVCPSTRAWIAYQELHYRRKWLFPSNDELPVFPKIMNGTWWEFAWSGLVKILCMQFSIQWVHVCSDIVIADKYCFLQMVITFNSHNHFTPSSETIHNCWGERCDIDAPFRTGQSTVSYSAY